jgi:hypothetical protein
MSSIAFREDDVITSKSQKDAHRARLAADIESFMAKGGEIVTCAAGSEQVELVDLDWLSRQTGLAPLQLRAAQINGVCYGVALPPVHSYSARAGDWRGREAHFRKTDALKFIALYRSARSASV